MRLESSQDKAQRTGRINVTLRANNGNCAYHLPRLADAIKNFAKNPSADNFNALTFAMEVYQNSKHD